MESIEHLAHSFYASLFVLFFFHSFTRIHRVDNLHCIEIARRDERNIGRNMDGKYVFESSIPQLWNASDFLCFIIANYS